MKKLHVKSLDDLDIVLRVSRNMLEAHGPVDVIVKKHDESLREAQRGLYWMWCGVIGSDLGNTKDEQHEYFKERFLLNIFIADTENHPQFVGVVENMLTVKKGCPEQYPYIRRLVLSGVSHMDATKKNMQDYLTEIENFAANNRIRLPAPERDGLL